MYSARTTRVLAYLGQLKKYSFDNQYILFDDVLNEIKILNPVALYLMESVNNGLSEAQIVSDVHQRFEVDLETAMADVRAFLHQVGTENSLSVEDVSPYVPITDFVPHSQPFDPVHGEYFLPGFQIRIASELRGLHERLSEMFVLPDTGDDVCEVLDLSVFVDGNSYPIVSQGRTLDTGLTINDTALKCLREINGLVAQSREPVSIIHASAVCHNNKAVLMPAKGGSGKSTLAAYLMHRGFEYLNDDAIPLLLNARKLLPVPVALSIKAGSWPVLEPLFPQLQQLRIFGGGDMRIKYLAPNLGQVRNKPVSCGLLVFPQYQSAVAKCQLEEVSKITALETIMLGGCTLGQAGNHDLMESLLCWLSDIPCYRLTYSTLQDAEQAIVSALGAHDNEAVVS